MAVIKSTRAGNFTINGIMYQDLGSAVAAMEHRKESFAPKSLNKWAKPSTQLIRDLEWERKFKAKLDKLAG